jgi:hypothetical protein
MSVANCGRQSLILSAAHMLPKYKLANKSVDVAQCLGILRLENNVSELVFNRKLNQLIVWHHSDLLLLFHI